MKRTPPFFPGFLELLTEFKSRGGLVTVVSHSEKEIIEGHYRANHQVIGWMPDMIFGWDEDQSKRKPSIYPVERILEAFKLQPREALIVDDLKPGVVMARAAGVPVAASGWGHDIPEIRAYMKEHCFAYLDTVGDLARSSCRRHILHPDIILDPIRKIASKMAHHPEVGAGLSQIVDRPGKSGKVVVDRHQNMGAVEHLSEFKPRASRRPESLPCQNSAGDIEQLPVRPAAALAGV